MRGYKEKGNINTPMELAINNEIDRFSLAIDAIDRVPRLKVAGPTPRRSSATMQIACRNYAYEHGIDLPEADNWTLAVLDFVFLPLSWCRRGLGRYGFFQPTRWDLGGLTRNTLCVRLLIRNEMILYIF